MILEQTKVKIVYTKSPVDIVVAVKSKFDKIKCVYDLKHETFKNIKNRKKSLVIWIWWRPLIVVEDFYRKDTSQKDL